MILLAAGGIGVTPVMGLLKDVYDFGLPKNMHNRKSHAIQTIYFMWVMPTRDDFEIFRHEIAVLLETSLTPGRPKLVVNVYITRSKETLQLPFISGRPKIGKVFDTMIASHPGKAGMVFACGPRPLVSELWDKSIQTTIAGTRIDFHHEVFDF